MKALTIILFTVALFSATSCNKCLKCTSEGELIEKCKGEDYYAAADKFRTFTDENGRVYTCN
jgi:hypothetical protein